MWNYYPFFASTSHFPRICLHLETCRYLPATLDVPPRRRSRRYKVGPSVNHFSALRASNAGVENRNNYRDNIGLERRAVTLPVIGCPSWGARRKTLTLTRAAIIISLNIGSRRHGRPTGEIMLRRIAARYRKWIKIARNKLAECNYSRTRWFTRGSGETKREGFPRSRNTRAPDRIIGPVVPSLEGTGGPSVSVRISATGLRK